MHSPLRFRPIRHALTLAVLIAFLAPVALGAQNGAALSLQSVRDFETRAQLEQAAAAAEREGRSSEAWLLRTRLQKGDFQEGDRVIVVLENSPTIDTIQVRAGKRIQFAGMTDLSLEGVLRSELADTVRHHLSRYLRNPGVRVTPLIPVSVLGSVSVPGYHYTPADVVLRDLIMRAGLTSTADLNRVTIRRAGETIWNAADVRIALADGLSIDRLHLRAGDEIVVPAQRQGISTATVFSLVSTATALVVLLTQIAQ